MIAVLPGTGLHRSSPFDHQPPQGTAHERCPVPKRSVLQRALAQLDVVHDRVDLREDLGTTTRYTRTLLSGCPAWTTPHY